MPMTRLETLKRKLIELEAAIAETEKRLPAHATKPPVMQDLLDFVTDDTPADGLKRPPVERERVFGGFWRLLNTLLVLEDVVRFVVLRHRGRSLRRGP